MGHLQLCWAYKPLTNWDAHPSSFHFFQCLAGHLQAHLDLVHHVGLRWTAGAGHAKGVPWKRWSLRSPWNWSWDVFWSLKGPEFPEADGVPMLFWPWVVPRLYQGSRLCQKSWNGLKEEPQISQWDFLTCGDYPKNDLESVGRAWTLPESFFLVWI